ncbi:MAG: tRNA lysidine(34) synthetase TilS [bacterium]|nr:tRNA lysidine(34) synthetase TilS [bacterium]
MINAVKKFIDEHNLNGKKILVGFSGGTDSTVLLDILSKIENIKPIAIHLNHNWRGEDSKKDEIFAYEFAKKRGLEFYTETLPDNIKKTETDARELRYGFFEKCKIKFKADAVFLAHNKNDNIETLIYRLIKGTGPKGLNSIPKTRDFYFRPLLDFKRCEIEKYAKENGVDFTTDKSNFDTKYKRNLIREKILPLMEEINPEAINSISTFIKINNMNQKIVDAAINKATSKVIKDEKILREEFLKLDIEIQYEIINRKFQGILKTRDFKTTERIVDFIKSNISSKMSIGRNIFLKIYNNKIYIQKKEKEKEKVQIPLKIGENKFKNYIIKIEKSALPDTFPNQNDNIQYLNFDFNNTYILRTRKEGDKVQTFGSKSIQKLKTLLIKKKIPLELRDEIPMIAIDNEIMFIPGILTSEKLRVDKNQKICYKLTIEKGN